MRDMTEGIDVSRLNWPFLKRNLPPMLPTEEEYNRVYTPQWNTDELVIRISPNNYHLLYEPLSEDWWVHDEVVRKRGLAAMDEATQERNARFHEKFGTNSKWMAEMASDEVEKMQSAFEQWIKGDTLAKGNKKPPEPPTTTEMQEDTEPADIKVASV